MTSSSSSTMTNSLIDEISGHFLTCEICSETFRRPKTLRCLHTFCEECLEIRYAIEEQERPYRFLLSRSLSCPLCFVKTELPPGGVRRLPDNAVVTQLDDVIRRRKLSSASATSGARSCDICSGAAGGVASSASAKCLECSKMLCGKCVEQHRKMKVTSDHCLFDVQVGKDIECKVHRDEEVRFFCDECQTCICVVCTFHDHSGHAIFSVSEAVDRYADGTQALLVACRVRSGALGSQLDAIRRCEAGIKAAEEAIRDAAYELIASIRRRERELMAQLQAVYSTELIAQKDPLAEMLRSANTTCDLVDSLLRQRSAEFLLVHREVTDKLNAILQCPVKDLPREMTAKNVRFTPCSKRPFDAVGHLHVSTPVEAIDGQTTEEYLKSFPQNGVPPTSTDPGTHSTLNHLDLRLDVTVAADLESGEDSSRYPPEAAEVILRNRIQSSSALRPPSPRGPDVWVPPKQRPRPAPVTTSVTTDTKFTTTTTIYTVDRSTMTSLRTTLDKNTSTDYLVVTRDQETFTTPPIQLTVSLQTEGPKRCSRSIQSCPDTLNKPTMTRRPIVLERETNTPPAVARFDCEVTARVLGEDKATETRTSVTVSVGVGTERNDEYSIASSSRDRGSENAVKHDGEDCVRTDSRKEDTLLSISSSSSSSSPLPSSSSLLSSSCSSLRSNTNAGENCDRNCKQRCQQELTCLSESKTFTCSECLNNKTDCERSNRPPMTNQSSKDPEEGPVLLGRSSDESNRRILAPECCASIESSQSIAAEKEKTPDDQTATPVKQTTETDKDVTSAAKQTNLEPTSDVSQSDDVISKTAEACEMIGDRLECVTDCADTISPPDSLQLEEVIETKEPCPDSIISTKNTVPDLVTSTLVGDKMPDCADKGAEEAEGLGSANINPILITEPDSDCDPKGRIQERILHQDPAISPTDSNSQIKPTGNRGKRDGAVMEDSVLPGTVKLPALVMRQFPEFVVSLTKTLAQMERLLPEISKIAMSFKASPIHGTLSTLLATISALITKACTKTKVLSDALDVTGVPDSVEDIPPAYTERASSPVRIPTRDMETSTRVSVVTRDSSTEVLPRVEIGVQSKRVASINRETSMETVGHMEKATSTPTVHLLNKNTATDNQVTVDAYTTMAADVTAAYVDAATRPVRRFSRGTSTPLRPTQVDRASSPVRFACVDKAVMARKGEALEPVDTFPGMGKAKGRRPFIVSRSMKAKLECISEGTIEEEESEDSIPDFRRVKVVHRSVTSVKDGQRSFASRGKVEFPLSPRPTKSSRNFFNFNNLDLPGKGQRATVCEEVEEDAFDP